MPDEYIKYLLESEYPYDKNVILSICINLDSGRPFVNYLLKNGAKFISLEEKVKYIESAIQLKFVNLIYKEKLMITCITGNFSEFKKYVKRGVLLKIGMINQLFKYDRFANIISSRDEKNKILAYLSENIDKLEELVHPRDHKKLEKIKSLVNLNTPKSPRNHLEIILWVIEPIEC